MTPRTERLAERLRMLPLAVALVAGPAAGVALAGCHMRQARDAATLAVATHGEVLRTYCTAAYDRARTEAEVAAVDARGCQEAADAHDAARAAVMLLDAAIAAGAPDADVLALLEDARAALADLASAVERVRAGR